MSFIIIGPGIQDPVKLDTLFDKRLIDKTGEISPKRRIETNRPVDPWERYPDVLIRRKHDQAFDAYKKIEDLHEETPVLFAQQIMTTPVLTLLQDAQIGEAIKLFHDRKFRHIPVVTAPNGEIAGMVSDRDVLHSVSGLTEDYERQKPPINLNISMTQLMKSPVLTAGIETDVRLIARLFVEYHIGSIPVTKEGNIAGIITRSDVLRAVMRHYALELWV